NTALDETGATLGPLVAAGILALGGQYRAAYGWLLASCILAISCLIAARLQFPLPSRLEEGQTAPARNLGRAFYLYMAAGACFAAGLISYELMGYHLVTAKIVD